MKSGAAIGEKEFYFSRITNLYRRAWGKHLSGHDCGECVTYIPCGIGLQY